MAKPPDAAALRWVGGAKKALRGMPQEVQLDFARRLDLAQRGRLPPNTKTWQGLGPGVFEMTERFEGDAYRAVYLARYKAVIYVLHAFQKKSATGRKTGQRDIHAIETALRSAIEDYKTDFKEKDKSR